MVRCNSHPCRTFLSNILMLGDHGQTRHTNPPRKGRHKTGRDLEKRPRGPWQKIACCRCRRRRKKVHPCRHSTTVATIFFIFAYTPTEQAWTLCCLRDKTRTLPVYGCQGRPFDEERTPDRPDLYHRFLTSSSPLGSQAWFPTSTF